MHDEYTDLCYWICLVPKGHAADLSISRGGVSSQLEVDGRSVFNYSVTGECPIAVWECTLRPDSTCAWLGNMPCTLLPHTCHHDTCTTT